MTQAGTGSETASFTYNVFGATRSVEGSGSTDFLFTGKQLDNSTSLYYLRARYYDPDTGRFLAHGHQVSAIEKKLPTVGMHVAGKEPQDGPG